MKLIETKTLGTAAASIEFTSIPQTFTDLVLLISGRDGASTGTIYMSFNNNGTGYTFRRLNGQGSAASSDSYSHSAIYWNMTGTNETASTFGNSSVYIPNYTGSTNKSVSIDGVIESNQTTFTGGLMSIVAGLWSNTAAITSIKCESNGNYVAGSTISLYGITKGSDGITTAS
jgi:hypothetical protein